jgi:hypothetical protein
VGFEAFASLNNARQPGLPRIISIFGDRVWCLWEGVGGVFHSGEPPIDRRPTARQSASRGDGQPPATEPALPPIRSGRAQPEATKPLPADRSLVSARRSWQRDLAAVDLEAPESSRALASKPDVAEPALPLIIPGDGKPILAPLRLPRRRPSRALHLALISFSFCLTLGVLWAATPLTAGATGQVNSFLGTVSLRALPTATPRPTATPVPVVPSGGGSAPNPGTAAIINEIDAVFGGYASGAIAVATCESGLNPNAWNPIAIMGSHAEGIFQILYPITWDSTSEAGYSPYDANANILAAHEIFARDGNSWREWACQP